MPRLRGLQRELSVSLPAVVGRDPACEVVLDDASVSRRHAVLERDGKHGCTLRDLASANGTFVGGIRLGGSAGVPVGSGARLRFGEVELLFVPDLAPAGGARRGLLATLGVVLLCASVALLLRGEPSRASGADASPSAPALVEEAQTALENDREEEAEALGQKALAADPLLDSAHAVLARARREREARRSISEALQAADDGDASGALHLLARVSQESRLFARARIKGKEIAAVAMRRSGAACRTESDAERWANAVRECGAAFEIACQEQSPAREPIERLLREAERHAERKVPWPCPPDLASLLRDAEPGAAPQVPPDELLAGIHRDAKIRAAVTAYLTGEPAEAMRALARQTTPAARAAEDRIRKIEGRSREGRTALLAGDLLHSDRAYAEALRLDAELLPRGVDSVPAKRIRAALAQAHGRLGDDYFSKGQYASAFDEWKAALGASPRDPGLLDSLARLDAVAQGIAEDGKASCGDLRIAARISSEGGPARAAAQRALSRCR